jgi:hypothetical protein
MVVRVQDLVVQIKGTSWRERTYVSVMAYVLHFILTVNNLSTKVTTYVLAVDSVQ